jgi:hypothetical protein
MGAFTGSVPCKPSGGHGSKSSKSKSSKSKSSKSKSSGH